MKKSLFSELFMNLPKGLRQQLIWTGGYIVFQNVVEERRGIGGIPCLCFYPSSTGVFPAVVLYHGWSSNKYNQRFLGSILATQGFFVVAPDAPRHGERDALDFESPEPVRSHFWEVVLATVQEAPGLLKTL